MITLLMIVKEYECGSPCVFFATTKSEIDDLEGVCLGFDEEHFSENQLNLSRSIYDVVYHGLLANHLNCELQWEPCGHKIEFENIAYTPSKNFDSFVTIYVRL